MITMHCLQIVLLTCFNLQAAFILWVKTGALLWVKTELFFKTLWLILKAVTMHLFQCVLFDINFKLCCVLPDCERTFPSKILVKLKVVFTTWPERGWAAWKWFNKFWNFTNWGQFIKYRFRMVYFKENDQYFGPLFPYHLPGYDHQYSIL